MQYIIRSNPFIVPLCGLLAAYLYHKFHCDVLFFNGNTLLNEVVNGIIFLIGLLMLLFGKGPKFSFITGSRRLLGLWLFHLGLGLHLFVGVGKDIRLPWPSNGHAQALIAVRDSLSVSKKGHAGTVRCLGWQSENGHSLPVDFTFRISGMKSNDALVARGYYWVETNKISDYSKGEIPSQPDWFRIMRALGINGHLKCDSTWVKAVGVKHWLDPVYQFRSFCLVRLKNTLNASLSPSNAGLMYAMLIGDKSGLDQGIELQFGVSGLLHVLAVSGMHVALIMGALLWLFTGFGARPKPQIGTLFLMISAGWIYTFFTGGSASVVRAMIGATWMWLGKFAFHRKQRLTHVLAGSGYIQWLIDPHCVEQLGFQLSYLAVLGIGTIHQSWTQLYESRVAWKQRIIESLSLTLSATLFTLPLIVWQFHSFPTWFLLGNLFLLPFFSAAVYAALICLICCGIPFLGDAFFAGFDWGLQMLLDCMGKLSQLPMPQLMSLPMNGWGLFFLGGVVWTINAYFGVLNAPRLLHNTPRKKHLLQIQWLLVICIVGVWFSTERHRKERRNHCETFKITQYNQVFTVVKNQTHLKIEGNLKNAQIKNKLWQKLQNYAVQNEIERVEWVLRLPLLHE